MKVLIVDDEPTILTTLGDAVADGGHNTKRCKNAEDALELLESFAPDCLITDLKLPGISGLELMQKARDIASELKVIVITGHGSIETAVDAMKLGATEYLTKPFLNEDIILRLERIEHELNLANELVRLKGELQSRYRIENIIGASVPMQKLFEKLQAVSEVEYDVLITGESGTGKELVARAIHNKSSRASGPFVPISCAALPENLLEDELFGHEKGAFTDAKKMRKGRFEAASGGTVMLDDIEDLPLSMQVKLLRVMQERTIERIGGNKAIPVDVRIISASKTSLLALVEDNEFRSDLYYRLNVLPVEIPSLRERADDIPLLVEHFIDMAGKTDEVTVSSEVVEKLSQCRWSGNVRELENAVKRALAFAKNGVLDIEHLLPATTGAGESCVEILPLKEIIKEKEKEHILKALKSCGNNRTEASRILGISRKSLWEKMKTHGIE